MVQQWRRGQCSHMQAGSSVSCDTWYDAGVCVVHVHVYTALGREPPPGEN